MNPQQPPRIVGRGTQAQPANRFEATHLEPDFEQLEHDEDLQAPRRTVPTQFLPDRSQSLITRNDSPDVAFDWSINPYRGCEHGCAYCYARPYHEYLGLSAGLDFETRILVKHDAPALLRKELGHPNWRGELIALSGVTDCYQPVEAELRLTRGCLEVMLEARQPVAIITKNALITRDLDVLAELAQNKLVAVNVSITSLDQGLTRRLEPRTSAPQARLRAIRELSAAAVPVRVMMAPIMPGINDHEIPQVLEAAREAGASSATYTLLRLPLAVEPIFRAWLAEHRPLAQDRVEALIRETRGGQLYDPAFDQRMRGQGNYAQQIGAMFQVFKAKHGLNQPPPSLDSSQFRPPREPSGQMRLF
ncbi:MAG: PA0069 family radical SAM protein [Pirellulales bacterium]|nr:PA0069 family radical SAM protein [Pirellulales bacterium]